MNIEWDKYLNNARDDFIHNYSGELAFQKNNGNFDLLIELPDMRSKGYKKHHEEYILQKEINEIIESFYKFLGVTKDILIERIKKCENDK